MNIFLDLFLSFAKIGLFTFGGGYAMISLIENNCVEKKKWITHDEMMDIAVIAESTPGPIAINCATFVGYKIAGMLGAVLATMGVVIPSFIIIVIISMFLDNFLEISLVANAFKGIKVGVGIIIVNAAMNMIKKMSSKKCVVKDFFKRDWTTTEKVLFALCLFLLGVVIGFLIAPIKKGISCGNNNGNTYNDTDDWCFEDEE